MYFSSRQLLFNTSESSECRGFGWDHSAYLGKVNIEAKRLPTDKISVYVL